MTCSAVPAVPAVPTRYLGWLRAGERRDLDIRLWRERRGESLIYCLATPPDRQLVITEIDLSKCLSSSVNNLLVCKKF